MSLVIAKALLISLTVAGATSALVANPEAVGSPRTSSAPRARASNPIPGVDIIVKKKPGGSMFRLKTNADGRITQQLPVGDYVVEVPYLDALKAATKSKPEVAGAKGKMAVSEITITLMYDCCPAAGDVNGDGRADVRMHKPFTVTKELSGPSLTITKVGGGVLSGQLLANTPPGR